MKEIEQKVNIEGVQYGFNHPAIKIAMRLMQDFSSQKTIKDHRNKVVIEMFEAGFSINAPDGLIKIHSKVLAQALLKIVSRTKPIDASFHATGAEAYKKKIMTDCIRTIADEGQFDSALRDKQGAYWTCLMTGDSFTGMWSNPKKNTLVPFIFSNLDNSNVYVNSNAIRMRGTLGKSVTQMVICIPMRWDEAVKLYPTLKKIGTSGRLPKDRVAADTFDKDTQEVNDSDITEIGYLFDISNLNYTIFAGSAMTVLEEYNGEEYPFFDESNEAYIPVMQHICIPAMRGFYNYGIGDIVYELALLSQQLLNAGSAGALDEALPVDLLNIPKEKASSFLNQILNVKNLRNQGKRPYLVNEFDQANPTQITSQTLQTNYGTRWAELLNLLNRELLRYGINLDDAAYQPNATATEVLAVEQAQVTFVKQMQEGNASEYQFFYGCMLSMIKTYVSTSNKDLINTTVTIFDKNGKAIEIDSITYGMVAKELQEAKWFVRINSRSGNIPSGIMEMTSIKEQLASTPKGTPAYYKSLQNLYSSLDRDVSLEDLGYQGNAPVQAGAIQEGVTATGTDREAINVRAKVAQPSIL